MNVKTDKAASANPAQFHLLTLSGLFYSLGALQFQR
jgi:hypothetical protein